MTTLHGGLVAFACSPRCLRTTHAQDPGQKTAGLDRMHGEPGARAEKIWA